jgi:acid stress chaperone HdeA
MKPTMLTACAFALMPLAAIAGKPPAKPVTTWTCEEFLAIDDTFRPKVVYWSTAYAKGGKPESTTIDVEGTEKLVPAIVDACTKSPKASYWQMMKTEWTRLAADVRQDVKSVAKDAKAAGQAVDKEIKAIEKKM